MNPEYVKKRIAQLRTQAKISARELSIRLGQSPGYINTIENGKSLPSWTMFFVICNYFKITPQEFFDEKIGYPALMMELLNESKKLDEAALISLLSIIKSMKK